MMGEGARGQGNVVEMRDGTTKVRMSRTEGKEKMEEEWGAHEVSKWMNSRGKQHGEGIECDRGKDVGG
jgi:hypothetical protein